MWTGQEMTFLDSFLISVVGLLVVFAALASLAVAIVIISRILKMFERSEVPKTAAAAAPAPAIDEESFAVLLAAVSEEARLSGEEFRVASIREL